MTSVIPPTIDVHLSADDLRVAMEHDVRSGLCARPKSIPPVYFYDDRGSRLFDEITRLPSTTRPGRSGRSSTPMPRTSPRRPEADTLVELGAGTCDKSRVLLDAMQASGHLHGSCPSMSTRQPCGRPPPPWPRSTPGWRSPRGGRLSPPPRSAAHRRAAAVRLPRGHHRQSRPRPTPRFLIGLGKVMAIEDRLLLGTDLVKDRRGWSTPMTTPPG